MLTNQSKLVEQTSKKYEHYGTYANCQSTAFMTSLFALVSSGAAIGLGQEVVKKLIPMTVQMRVMAPVLGGSLVGYVVARQRTQTCQDMWLALEGKHSALSAQDINLDVKDHRYQS